MAEYSSYITLAFSILFGVFMFFGFIWGIIRGLKKTAGRGIFLLVTSILLIFLSVPITNLILKIKIDCNISTPEMELIGSYNLAEILTAYLKNLIGADFIAKYPDFASLIINFGIILINALVFLILFWLLKWFLLPLNSLFTKLIFFRPKYEIIEDENGKKKKKKIKPAKYEMVEGKNGKQKKKKIKPKKQRLLGGLVGIAVGFVVTFNTMIPLWGVLDIAETIDSVKIENLADETTDVHELTEGTITDLSDAYRASAMGFATKYTGLEYLGLLGFDGVTTAKFDDERITLRHEVKAIVNTIDEADKLFGKFKTYQEDNFKSITQEELDSLLGQIGNLVDKCKEVKLVDCLADYVLPLACSYMLKSETEFTSNEAIDEMIKDTLKVLIEKSGINIMDEINALLDIAKYTSEQGLLIKVIKGDTSNPLELLDGLEDDFAKNLMTKVFALQTVDTTITHILNIGLTYADQLLEFGYKSDDLTKENVENGITNILDATFKLAKSFDSESSMYITFDSLKPLGKLMDTIKSSGLINTETYDNIMDFTAEKLREMADEMVPSEFVDVFSNQIADGVKNISNWEAEMTAISEATNVLRAKEGGFIGEVKEGFDLRQGTSMHFELNETTIQTLGKALDKLEGTTLFGSPLEQSVNKDDVATYVGTTITKLVASICDYINDDIIGDDETLGGFKRVVSSIRENTITAGHVHSTYEATNGTVYTGNTTFFENEFKEVAPLIVELGKILTNDEGENSNFSVSLGEALDKAKTSTLLGNNTTLIMVEETLNLVSDAMLGSDFEYNDGTTSEQRTDDKIYELFEGIKEKLNSTEIKTLCMNDANFWATEIESYIALKDVAEKASNLDSNSNLSELGEKLDNVYACRTIPKDKLNGVLTFSIRQLKTNELTGINSVIDKLIDDIADAIENETFSNTTENYYKDYWKIELGHIDSLKNTNFTINDDDKSTTDVNENLESYKNIGRSLDKVLNGYDTTRASYLINREMVANLMSGAIDTMKDDITKGFTDTTIKTAVETAIDSISTEIKNKKADTTLSYETELSYIANLANIKISNDVFKNMTSLQALGKELDKIAYAKTTDNTSYDDSQNSKIITRSTIGTLICDIMPIAKSGNTEPTNVDKTIDAIITNTKTVVASDTVLSWETELAPMSNLIKLKDTEVKKADIEMSGVDLGEDGKFTDEQLNDNVLIDSIAKTLDEIAFNNDGSKYTQNSLLITRSILKDLVAGFLADSKAEGEADEDKITNAIIDNTTGKINTTDTFDTGTNGSGTNVIRQKKSFNTFKEAFTELLIVNKQINNMKSDFSDSVDISTMDASKASSLDTMLNKWQSNLICGVSTTKDVAILLLKNIKSSMNNKSSNAFESTEVGKYVDALIARYTNDKATKENYILKTPGDNVDKLTSDGNAKNDSNEYIYSCPFERIVNVYNPNNTNGSENKTISGGGSGSGIAKL